MRSTADCYLERELDHAVWGIEAGEVTRSDAAAYLAKEVTALAGDGASVEMVDKIRAWVVLLASGKPLATTRDALIAALSRD